MVAGGKFQVESIRRLVGATDPISAIYAASVEGPGWPIVTELAMAGSPLNVVCGRAGAAEFRKLAERISGVALHEIPDGAYRFGDLARSWPASYNLLVVDDYAWQRDLLQETLAAGVKPQVIAARDGEEDAAERRAKYALLIQMGYYFAGLCGEHSLWTRAKQMGSAPPVLLTELAPEFRRLEHRQGGVVQLDQLTIPPGEIHLMSARADFGVSGWAILAEDAPLATHLFAKARHEETGVEEYLELPRESRRDVANHFRSERLLLSGFRADLSPLCHRIGAHSVTLVQTDGEVLYESKTLFRFALQLQEYELAARAGLANRYLRGSGIEIGALQKPARINGTCQVRYIDRMPIEKLLEHYPEMAKIPVQAPDIVDDGQRLEHIAEDSQDFVIANHFLEHCPDPIRSIHNMLRVVKQGGMLFLAVPDKRHTFDLRRPVTPYAALRNAFVSGQRAGRGELFYEWAHLVYNLPPEQAKERAVALMEEDYSIHYNVWAATDLLSFLLSARQDFQIPFELAAAVSSENENIVLLERTAGRLPL